MPNNSEKRDNRCTFSLLLSPGNYGQASTSAKSAEKLKTPGERRVPRESTHTQSMCTRTAGGIQRRGEELSPQTLLDNPDQWDADYLNKKIKIMETTNVEKLKMRWWMSIPNF
jgi:hypothetical protein